MGHGTRGHVGRPLAADCGRHRPALLALLEDPSGSDIAPAARDHLEGCARCRSEVSGIVLAGLAVRRAFAGAAASTPPDDDWPRLRRRLERRPARLPAFASSVAGLLMAAAMASALVVSTAMPAATRDPGGLEVLEPVSPAAITRLVAGARP